MKLAVSIKKYDKNLPKYFESEKKFLTKHFGKNFQIHHIGSSAVPGLGGKNVVDVQLLSPDKKTAISAMKKLIAIRYKQLKEGGDKYRIAFYKDKKGIHFHLHLMWKTVGKYKAHLIFRDYLRKHPEEAENYFILKKKWAKEAGAQRRKYTELKTSYVNEVLKKAKKR